MVHSCAFIMVAQYFEKRRGVALGLATSCVGLGGLTLSIVFNYLFDSFGYNGAMLIYCKRECAFFPYLIMVLYYRSSFCLQLH